MSLKCLFLKGDYILLVLTQVDLHRQGTIMYNSYSGTLLYTHYHHPKHGCAFLPRSNFCLC